MSLLGAPFSIETNILWTLPFWSVVWLAASWIVAKLMGFLAFTVDRAVALGKGFLGGFIIVCSSILALVSALRLWPLR
jgi:hypothetical protein